MQEKITYTVKEVSKIMGISSSLTYRLIRENEIPNIRLGSRILIPKKYLNEYIEQAFDKK